MRKRVNWRDFFNGRKITQMGLGLLGRGVGDAGFLAECGADLTVTDLKTATELAPSINKLKKHKSIEFVLGGHHLEDFKDRDFILKGAGVPLDSPFINEARKNGIPVEMDASLFAKLAPEGVRMIGVTGTRGKTTTTFLIYEILRKAFGRRCVFLGGNIKDIAALPLLKKVKAGDFVVMELDSWQLQGFGEAGVSPSVAIFTTFFPDHLNYYDGDMRRYFADKANIFRSQKAGDCLVAGEQAADRVKGARPPIAPLIARAADLPTGWRLKIIGEHNRANAACAAVAARALGVSDSIIKEVVEGFRGVPGRLEPVRTFRGVKIYNDTTATTPEATIAALRALSAPEGRRRVVLIAGGSDKGLDMSNLIAEIPKHCKAVMLLEGTGTKKLLVASCQSLGGDFGNMSVCKTLKECLRRAVKVAEHNDVILFSPAFASFGPPPSGFKNEYERGGQFVRLAKKF